nr:hypothetical protein [Euzebyaceae bacterium]
MNSSPVHAEVCSLRQLLREIRVTAMEGERPQQPRLESPAELDRTRRVVHHAPFL